MGRVRRIPAVAVALVALGPLGACRSKPIAKGKAPLPTAGATAIDAGEFEGRYEVKSWSFALERTRVLVTDLNMSRDLSGELARSSAELVVNGGFFGPNGGPIGLASSEGAERAAFARDLSGGVLTIEGDRGRLYATESFAMPADLRFAVQCRPRLVVNGKSNIRGDDEKQAERTALCLKDGGRTLDVFVVRSHEGGPTLFALAGYLATKCEDALNLDGGPSTGAAWNESRDGGITPTQIGPRGPVRLALAFVKR